MNTKNVGDASLTQDGDEWVLGIPRLLGSSRAAVWAALTDAEQIPQWAPFKADRDVTSTGPVKLAYINYPGEGDHEGYVLEVSPQALLVFQWGDDVLRWELSNQGDKTGLVLRHRFSDVKQAPSYAAGWHLCLEGMTGILAGKDMPSMVGLNAVNYGYDDLYQSYAALFGL